MSSWKLKKRVSNLAKQSALALFCLSLTGCYSITQGYYQVALLWKREDLKQVLEAKNESEERLKKLKLVPEVLEFARKQIGLQTGGSYQSYIRLDGPVVTNVVQAAEKRALKRKTWWFPIIGEQPYLGFFDRQDAKDFQKELVEEGYDTRLGGVTAFSLLGYFPDPLYSSMIDGRSVVDLVDLLIHESVHQTLYIPGSSTFNESFASFVAREGTIQYLNRSETGREEIEKYASAFQNEVQAARKFQVFLDSAKKELRKFYKEAEKNKALKEESAFLKERKKAFVALEKRYDKEVRPLVKGTWYERAFVAERTNNAVVLAYSLYEARPEPFEAALKAAGGDIAQMVKNLKHCFEGFDSKNEKEMWKVVSNCNSDKPSKE